MESIQLKSAEANYKKGVAALKTGLFKWKKDYEEALMYFGDAAKEFKAAKQINKAIQAYQKVIEVAKITLDHWAVAHNIEQIVTLSIENKIEITPQKIYDLVEEAVSYYKQDNSTRNSVLLCQKIAKQQFSNFYQIQIFKWNLGNIYCTISDKIGESRIK